MAYTSEDLAAINEAIATGALEVRYADGRMVKYRSLADMRSIRDEIETSLGLKAEPLRTTYTSFSRD